MPAFRRFTILTVNALVLAWLLKVTLHDQEAGFFLFVGLGFLLAYNAYAVVVYLIFPGNARRQVSGELGFVGLLLLPFGLLYLLTS